MPKIKTHCLNCNKLFLKEQCTYKKSKRHFCCKKCSTTYSKGKNHPNYRGGIINKHGYKQISIGGILYFEHRLIMEKHLGRKLKPFPAEIVHHVNRKLSDNRIENLELIKGSGNHLSKKHSKKRIVNGNLKKCSICHKWFPLNRFSKESSTKAGIRNDCKSCQNKRNKKRLKNLQ